MDEEVKMRVLKLLDGVESSASTAGQFVLEQTPLVAQEYVAYFYWSSLIWMLACVAMLSGIASIICLLVRLSKAAYAGGDEEDAGFYIMACLVVGGFLGAPVIIATADCTEDLIKVSCAPRVVLLEKASELAGVKQP